MEYSDKKIVRITLVVLFLSLFLVYVVFFEQQKQERQTIITKNENNMELEAKSTKENKENQDISLEDIEKENIEKKTTGDSEGIMQDTTISSPRFTGGSSTSVVSNDILQAFEKTIKDLTGTTASFKEPDVAKDLGLDYQYVLEDGSGVLYVYMGTGGFDYETEVKKLGGDVVIFRTELDIEKNNLPGEQVMFINIPGITYDKKPVLTRKRVYMVVWMGGDERIVQIPYDQYHKHKKVIKKIFTESYKNNN